MEDMGMRNKKVEMVQAMLLKYCAPKDSISGIFAADIADIIVSKIEALEAEEELQLLDAMYSEVNNDKN
jgi:hypothetical protein